MHINDLHATILHLLGIDHERLTYRYAGRDFRLTDVAGQVAERYHRIGGKTIVEAVKRVPSAI